MPQISGPISSCEKCGGEVWDNRAKKNSGEFSAKSPDFVCKDKTGCGESYWLSAPKAQAGASRKPWGAPRTPEPQLTWIELQAMYWRCLSIVKVQLDKLHPDATPADHIAAAATLFIKVSRTGVKAAESKVPPPPRKEQPLEEKPKAVDEEQDFEHSDLPF